MLSWVSCDALTGQVLADLPGIECDTVSAVIGAYTSAQAALPVGGVGTGAPPENWERAVAEGMAVLWLVDDSQVGADPVPLWGGLVLAADRDLGDRVQLSLSTLEATLDRYYVGDETYTATGQNAIVSDLIATYVDIPFHVVQVGGAGTPRDLTCEDAADKTVLSIVSELMNRSGGIEWTITGEWLHEPERIRPVLTVGSRLGADPAPGMGPAATFEAPGPVVQAKQRRDYSAGKGARDVMAVSSAAASERPQSPRQVVPGDRPSFQDRFTPSTSISEVETLTAHAQRRLSLIAEGTRSLTLEAVIDEAPRLGRDWFIGDTIGYRIGGLDAQGRELAPAFPGGIEGAARAIGWEIHLGAVPTIAPIFEGA